MVSLPENGQNFREVSLTAQVVSVPLPAAQAAVLPCPQLSRGDILTATNTHAAAAAAAGRHSTLMVSITVQAQNS